MIQPRAIIVPEGRRRHKIGRIVDAVKAVICQSPPWTGRR